MQNKRFAILLALVIIFAYNVSMAVEISKHAKTDYVVSELKIEGTRKANEVLTVTHLLTALKDIEHFRISMLISNGMIVDGERWKYYGSLKAGQKVITKWSVKINNVPSCISVTLKGGRNLGGGPDIEFLYMGEDGTLLTRGEYNESKYKLIEYRYDPEEPLTLNEQNIQPGMITDEKAKATRAAIENLNKTKGPISDLEAIELLHNRIELFIRSGVEGQKAIDILWEAHERTKSKGGDYWKNVEKIVTKKNIIFFRLCGHNEYSVSYSGFVRINNYPQT